MSEFSVGYSRVCITPRESVPLAGYGNTDKRMSQSVSSDLCSTCLAFTDETGESALIVTNDLILTNASWAQAVRAYYLCFVKRIEDFNSNRRFLCTLQADRGRKFLRRASR